MATGSAATISLTRERERSVAGRSLERLLRFIRNKPLGAATGFVILLVVVAAVFAPLLAPYDPTQTSLIDSLRPPSAEHLMGTDRNGRDLFSRIIYGARVSL